jgi:VanZ family protein
MHKLILWVRQLRGVPSFKISTRILVIVLMIAGAWVATITLDFPETIDINDYLKHFIVFFGFAFLLDLAISRHPFWLWKGLPLLIYGAMIEIMQYFSPERSFSILDWLADFSGILLYFLIKLFLLWLESIRSTNDK